MASHRKGVGICNMYTLKRLCVWKYVRTPIGRQPNFKRAAGTLIQLMEVETGVITLENWQYLLKLNK